MMRHDVAIGGGCVGLSVAKQLAESTEPGRTGRYRGGAVGA